MRRGKKILITAVIPLLLLAAIIVVISHFLGGPAQGQVAGVQAASNNSPALTFNMNPVKVSGKYILFSYPAALSAGKSQSNSGSELENYLYTYKDSETWLLTIEVSRLSQPNLDYNSSYSIRAQDPSRYQASTSKIGPNRFYLFKDISASDFAETAFILNGDMSTSISLTGNDPTSLNSLQDTYSVVLDSFQWK